MAAHARLLAGLLAVCVVGLPGCADSGSTAPAVSEAERQLGASLLAPQGSDTSVGGLDADELPPDGSGAAELDAADLPPAP